MITLNAFRNGPRSGGVLLVALVVASAMAALAIGMLQVSGSAMRRQSSALDTKGAFYLAEAGLAEAYGGIRVGKTGNVGSEAKPARLGDGLFWVEATEIDAKRIRLQSTGMRGLGRAVLAITVERGDQSVASLGVFAQSPLNIPAGVRMAGYDSNSGVPPVALPVPQDAPLPPIGRVGSNGSITATGTPNSPTLLYADLAAGPQQTTTLTGVTHVGKNQPRSAAAPLPPVEVPFEPTQSGVEHRSRTTLVLTGDQVGLAFLKVADRAQVVVAGPCRLVVNSLSVTSKGALEFDTSTGPVSVWVKEGMTLSSGAIVSTRGTDPSQFQLQLPSAAPASMRGTGKLFGVVYAPEAEVTVGGQLSFHGSLVAKSLQMEPGATLYFDTHLDQVAGKLSVPKLVSWRLLEMATASDAKAGRDPFQLLGVEADQLDCPAKSHEDVALDLSYTTLAGATATYRGLESAFDWTKVREVLVLARNGETVQAPPEAESELPPKPPPETAVMTALEADPRPAPGPLKSLLIASSPLSSEEIVKAVTDALTNNAMLDVLRANLPINEAGLYATAARVTPFVSADLKEILIKSRPLPPSIQAQLVEQVLLFKPTGFGGLTLADARAVLSP